MCKTCWVEEEEEEAVVPLADSKMALSERHMRQTEITGPVVPVDLDGVFDASDPVPVIVPGNDGNDVDRKKKKQLERRSPPTLQVG